MGLTNFKGEIPSKKEAETAKNYLTKDELDMLNRMVTAFLKISEIQALDRTPMYMADYFILYGFKHLYRLFCFIIYPLQVLLLIFTN
jgi:hypothetical protein